MKAIIDAVCERLMDECKFLRQSTYDIGQLNEAWGESSRPPVAFPCALVSCEITRARELYPGVQECDADISVTYAEIVAQGEVTDPYERITKIYSALQSWYPVGDDGEPLCYPFDRARGRRINADRSGLYRYLITFRTAFEDRSAVT